MDWKYVVLKVSFGRSQDVREIPVIFPGTLIHSVVANHMVQAMKDMHVEAGLEPPKVVQVLSAGQIGRLQVLNCHGKSDTLGLNGRGGTDTRLINHMQYLHGIPEE